MVNTHISGLRSAQRSDSALRPYTLPAFKKGSTFFVFARLLKNLSSIRSRISTAPQKRAPNSRTYVQQGEEAGGSFEYEEKGAERGRGEDLEDLYGHI
jgi:hypothetical protein